ncbi:MAG TPA: hypothetical protein VJQ43_06355 [Thermoplasmata archaeon]|nr:hypothetical protein [Thermoplasmata archaeon]
MLPDYPESTRRALARSVLQHTLRLKRGEKLLLYTWSGTLPWANSFVLEARLLGARPLLIVEDESTMWQSVDMAPGSSLGRTGGHEWAALRNADAYLELGGPLDTDREIGLPKAVASRVDADNHEWYRLIQKYGVRSVRWDLGRTSPYWAKRYGVDLASWRRELIDAATVDPRELQRDGAQLAHALRKGREVSITHPNGTDLTLRLAGRAPMVDDGVIDEADIRSGNVFTIVPSGVATAAVDETYAEGTIVSNNPGVLFVGAVQYPLTGGTWTFRKGRLARFEYEEEEAAFRREFTKAGPGKDRPGILSIGLNPGITSIPLLFDQQRGTVTISVGRNAMSGGSTRTPHFTAYHSVRDATVRIDGRPVVDDGKFP